MSRPCVLEARRIVIKVGSSSLASPEGGLDDDRVDALVDALATRRAGGTEIVLVSSGAIAAGLAPLRLARRPRDLATLQAAASVGQGLLIERYSRAFARSDLCVGQVLLTAEDMMRRAHYRNARRTFHRLLHLGVVPIVNENDAVATDEIRLGDNDRLAALTTHLVAADLLVLLSDVPGVFDADPRSGPARKIDHVRSEADLAHVTLRGPGRAGVGSGGMATKVTAARVAAAAGAWALICTAGDIGAALAGAQVGTLFHPEGRRTASRLLWLRHATIPLGRLVLDDGAVAAVVGRRMSLLAAGVVAVAGDFSAGDPVELADDAGKAVARGLVAYDAAELPAMLGRSTGDLAAELGPSYQREVVHRDDLVLL
ncbi:MAG: glutamate 5-kinase [Frankiaceae bacterium]